MNMILLALLQLSFADANSRAFIKVDCINKLVGTPQSAAICECYDLNLAARLDDVYFKILEKQKKGKSIKHELNTIEGAAVISTYDRDVMTACKKDPTWRIGPEDKGTPDEN